MHCTAFPELRPLLGGLAPVTGDGGVLGGRCVPARVVVGLLLAVAMVGCPHGEGPSMDTLPAVATDDPDAEEDMRLAREAAEAGRTDEARARYGAFLTEHPADPLVPVAELALGRLELAAGRPREALAHFERVAAHPDPTVAERGRFHQGIALHAAGEDAPALALLQPLVGRTVDPADTALLLLTVAQAAERVGDHVSAVSALDRLLAAPVAEEHHRAASADLLSLVTDRATAEELQTLYASLPHEGFAWRVVATRSLRVRSDAGDLDGVRAIAAELRAAGVELPDELLAIVRRAEVTGEADPRVIGAILPLSGRGREVGQLAMRGLTLAAGAEGEGPALGEATQVVFRDSADDPERAARAVEDLVSTHRVIAIVGPIDGPAAARAAARAEELGVPLITLTPAAGVTDAGRMVFRLFFTPDGEIRELVAAARARGARRFAVLFPEHGYGRAMRALFAAEVTRQGGELVAQVGYPDRATTFRDAMTALRAANVDALFVPDNARQVSLIAPALASTGLWNAPPSAASGPTPAARPLTLLLPSVAYGDQLLRTTGRYLQGAILSQPFHAPTAQGDAALFVERYQARFGTAPDMFAAYAYDALELVRATVAAGAVTRDEVASHLARSAGARTAGPSRGLTPERGPVHGTRLLEVRGAELVPLDR